MSWHFGSRIFVGAYLVLQLAVAVFSLRYWPLTDYPMFSTTHSRFDEIHSFRLRGVRFDGSEEWLPRGTTVNFGHSDFKIRANLQAGNEVRARAILAEHIRRHDYFLRQNYSKLILVERRLKRVADQFPADTFFIEDRNRFEIPIERSDM